jgi:hypothetical protein
MMKAAKAHSARMSVKVFKTPLAVTLLGIASIACAANEPCAPNAQPCVSVLAQANTASPIQAQPVVQAPVPESGKSRGIFLAMFAQQLLPAVTSGVDSWLKSKLNDTVTGQTGMPQQMSQQMPGQMPGMPQQMDQQMPTQMPGMPQQMSQQMPSQMPQQDRQDDSSLQAGVAYQVSVVGRDGSRVLVDPTQRSFATGERVEVSYRTNLPGLVEVFNIDSTGREERIDQKQLGAAQLAVLGPYEFVNATGSETLRINLRPCVGGAAGSSTRSMIRAQVNPELAGALVGCDDPALRQQRVGTRGIVKVAVDGGTNFALDPVSRAEIDSGQIAPREVSIRFLHR